MVHAAGGPLIRAKAVLRACHEADSVVVGRLVGATAAHQPPLLVSLAAIVACSGGRKGAQGEPVTEASCRFAERWPREGR